jgi:arylsulfatase A-like enzyme
MIGGLAFGLLDALLAIAMARGRDIQSLRTLWISLACWGLAGGAGLAIGVWLISGRTGPDAAAPPRRQRVVRGPLAFATAVLLVSLAAYLVGRPLALATRFVDHTVRGTALGFLATGLVVVLALRLTGAARPGVSTIRLAVVGGVCLTLTAAVAFHLRHAAWPPAFDSGAPAPRPVAAAPVTHRPNVLLIVMDTARADRLSLYGGPRKTSPFLEELARTSTVYTRAISAAPWTLPSHASMFTGQFPAVHQATSEHRWLRPEFTTLAEILRDAGYATAGFSCNSVVGAVTNLNQGFDQFYEVWKAAAESSDPEAGLWVVPVQEEFQRTDPSRDKGARLTNQLVESWLDQHGDEDPKRPFFVFINYIEPHLPYLPPRDYRERFLQEPLLPVVRQLRGDEWLPTAFRLMGRKESLSPDACRQLFALYDAALCYLDQCLRELIGRLVARNLLDDTLVIIVSDHGENIGEHGGLLDHCLSVHQTLLRVPLLVRYPPRFQAGLQYDGLVSTVSIFPTVLDVVGAAAPAVMPCAVGRLPEKAGELGLEFAVSEYELPVFDLSQLASESGGADITPFAVRQRAIQSRDWKIIARSDGRSSLYDLTRDPGEETPLDPQWRGEGVALAAALQTWVSQVRAPTFASPAAQIPMDEKTRQSLRALGYVR